MAAAKPDMNETIMALDCTGFMENGSKTRPSGHVTDLNYRLNKLFKLLINYLMLIRTKEFLMTREDIIDHIESLYTQSAILKQVSVIKEPRLTDRQF